MSASLTRRALPVAALALAAAGGITALSAMPEFGLPDPTLPGTSLEAVERAVFRLLPLPEMTTATLARRLEAGGRGLVLFDVREAEEFATSHIPGAIHLPPDIPGWAFARAHGPRIAGTEVVFTCSVGLRSGRMLARVRKAVEAARPLAMANLRGGLFRWHAEGRRVVDAAGATTTTIHPFDTAWGQLLDRTLAGA